MHGRLLLADSMSDPTYTTRPRTELLDAIRHRSSGRQAPLRILAEDVLGAGSTIDLVAVDTSGRLVLLLVCEAGEDLELFTRGLAQRAWVAPRVRDWLQLAPALGVRADGPVRLSLLAPSFREETLAAAEALGPQIVELSTYRWIQNGSAAGVLIEPISPAQTGGASRLAPHPAAEDPFEQTREPQSASGAPAPAASSGSQFRTGLTEEDLNLTDQESREFE